MLDVRADGVAVVGETRDLHALIDHVERDGAIRAVVISCVVPSELDALTSMLTASDAEAWSRDRQRALARIAASKKPFVAAVEGDVLGPGFELALACHGRVATEAATFGFSEVKLGLIPCGNGLQRAARLLGLNHTLNHALRGDAFAARTCADEVVPAPLLREVACKHARARADRPRKQASLRLDSIGRVVLFRRARHETRVATRGHYPAAFSILDVLETFAARGLEASTDVEARAFGELVVSETAKQLIATSRAVEALTGELPDVAIEKIGIVGPIDPQIVCATVRAGIHVRLRDRDDAALARTLSRLTCSLSRITATTRNDGFRRASVVLTSTELPIETDGVIASTVARENAVPVSYEGPLVEIVRGPNHQVVAALARRQGRTPLVVDQFYTRRLRAALDDEIAHLVKETAGVDDALVDWGFPHRSIASSAATRAPSEEIQMRATLRVVNEAVRCLGDAVRSPRDGDLGAILGLGFPPFRGGPFRYVDSIGASEILRRTELYRKRFGERFEPADKLRTMGNDPFYY